MTTALPSHWGDVGALQHFHPVVRAWFCDSFLSPTTAQARAWPAIAAGRHTLLLAPTGSGKTLAAFLVAIDRLMFRAAEPVTTPGVRVVYVSPLKALGVDVERNLRAPLAGVRLAAERDASAYRPVTVAVRSGDTDSRERRRLAREPADILITTPESLYLLLTSRAREVLAGVDTVIVDEIHALVGTKRGAHLAVSLERLADLRDRRGAGSPGFQRIGLSATQRPLAEVARFLGGATPEVPGADRLQPRDVAIIDAAYGKALEIRVEVPVEDMARLGQVGGGASGNAAGGPTIPSIWPALHPRLVELIRAHRSTILFANSRRLAERLASAINETAGEELALAHHGSIAKHTRQQIEDRLKRGELPAIVATSTLELGIDMGAVDLVIQIEAPPSIAAGIQRVGRASHQVGGRSTGVVFPKYRGDLLACSAAVERMQRGEVESTSYPRNPLDVLAQQLVATVALETRSADELYGLIRRAAPFQDLPRASFDGVLDLLAGRYPSDQFAELRPRVTWDRLAGTVAPRPGAQRLAVLNAGTIPDRGLYGVYLAGAEGSSGARVGELDEEMVFESKVGDVFLLGASSWRVLDISRDRVLVTPAPGEPGRMPFWRGDGPGRPWEFGQAIGQLARRLVRLSRARAEQALVGEHGLDAKAARNLLDYLHDQREATEEVPSDQTVIVECFLDEVGDWRTAVLSPFGSRVHAPWAAAVAGRLRAALGDVDLVWSDDGMMFRLPESDGPPPLEVFFPPADEIEALVVQELHTTALFAARFRENAARALLLPRRRAGGRTPLWLQRRRAADLLAVAAQFPSFPILLETYRECLRDVFDLPGLKQILQDVERRTIRARRVETNRPSPFAAALLFSYTANFLYEGDAPLAERRAQTLALDHAQLRELLGDAELRELLDRTVVDELALHLQRLEPAQAVRHADGVHDLLLYLGDLTAEELAARTDPAAVAERRLEAWLTELTASRRIMAVRIAGQWRYAAAEDAARLRDALGVTPPPGLPAAFLETVAEPLEDLVARFARTHVPFTLEDVQRRLGLPPAAVRATLDRLVRQDRVLEGEFLPGGRGREWCDSEVLRSLKRRSLARLRHQIEPVAPSALARFLPDWQGVTRPRAGLDALLDAVEQLQGLPLPAVALERWILPARVTGYQPSELDQLCVGGEILWQGAGSRLGGDGRVALYLTDHYHRLAPAVAEVEGPLAAAIRQTLRQRGAVLFDDLARVIGGFRNDVLEALWDLVWAGEVTNDTFAPLRSLQRAAQGKHSRQRSRPRQAFRSRRQQQLPGSEGRWSLLSVEKDNQLTETERRMAVARQFLQRHGIVTRETVASEGIPGGFAGLYPVLKALEEAGQVRRGYFVAGLGGAQFALPGADDRLRTAAAGEAVSVAGEEENELLVLAACDPANAYGAALPWPPRPDVARPQRAAGARVILHRGQLLAFIARGGDQLLTFLPADDALRLAARHALLEALAQLAAAGEPVYLTQIDGRTPGESPWANDLIRAGFSPSSRGFLLRPLREPQT